MVQHLLLTHRLEWVLLYQMQIDGMSVAPSTKATERKQSVSVRQTPRLICAATFLLDQTII
jgi:hypothetical protein